MTKLYKSRDNKIVSGIFGGIGETIDIDPVVACFAIPKAPKRKKK